MKIFISIREWTPSHVELSNMHYTERGKITPTMYAYELEMEDDGKSWWDNTMCAYLSRVASRYAKKGTLHSMLESKGAKLLAKNTIHTDYFKEAYPDKILPNMFDIEWRANIYGLGNLKDLIVLKEVNKMR